ncbi:WD40 repeat-like protein [Rhizopogon vinicolor AM-OR11-026]|uniref:WD40 repeat-like protein n=1 Tax=Rhizopogon vinicolor AM-OR11-026 TaxID=1314800 RepID=A0A1B7MRU1_9AGAM|nr:WD40 repeat-like protein [Rhizopogon vinicolor AM-OR11-026]
MPSSNSERSSSSPLSSHSRRSSSSSPSSSLPLSGREVQETSNVMPCKPSRTIRGWMNDAVYLPDGWCIITCSDDGSLRLWDLESGTQIGDEWRDGEKEAELGVNTIALSPNGKTIASGSSGGNVRLWDVKTRKHTDHVSSLCWAPDGERVVSGSWDGTARVWNAKNGKTVVGPIKTGQIYAVAYSPDGTKIATGGYHNAVEIWDSTTGEHLGSAQIEDSSVRCLAWTSDVSGHYTYLQ